MQNTSGDQKASIKKNGVKPATSADLVDLLLGPLADQIDRARLEILANVKDLSDSISVLARQVRRELD